MIVIIGLAMIYGACMGSFSLFKDVDPAQIPASDRYLQVLASTLKVPALFALTLLITLPSLYVFNALVGSRLDLRTLFRLLVAALGVNLAVLVSLGPIVAFFSVSTTSYRFMQLFNVVIFGVAGVLGLLFLMQTLNRMSQPSANDHDLGDSLDEEQNSQGARDSEMETEASLAESTDTSPGCVTGATGHSTGTTGPSAGTYSRSACENRLSHVGRCVRLSGGAMGWVCARSLETRRCASPGSGHANQISLRRCSTSSSSC